MHIAVIICIVVASLLCAILITWGILSLYTWNKLSFLNPKLKPVPISPAEYAGKWYEVASRPPRIQAGCSNTTAEYTVEGDRLRVVNSCLRNGKYVTAKGYAYPTNNKGVFGVSFFPGIYGNYTVIYRDPETSIVSEPKQEYVWILSRTPQISPGKRERLFIWLKKHDFDTKNINYTKQ